MAGKKEKALEEELELYKRKSMLRGRWDRADKRHKKQVLISLLIILILFAVFLYSLMKSISEPVYLDRDMYMELIGSESGSCWALKNNDRKAFEELLMLPSLKKKVYVFGVGAVLYLSFTDGTVSLEYPFDLDDGVIRGEIEGAETRLYFSESASGKGRALSIYSDAIEAELNPYSDPEQPQ